jgi:hypothetical protein
LAVGELAIKGGQLIAAGVLAPGPAIGETMRALLAWVLDDPARNEPDTLIAYARTRQG